MDTKDLNQMLRPSVLLHVTNEIKAADGGTLVKAGQLIAARAWVVDYWGIEVAYWTHPSAMKGGTLTIRDLELAEVRPPTADEERSWLTLGAET